ncbi:MAG: DUF58 domain-containing protein [Flavobacteriaceae bacterium]|nr:DUF58 domain-containing protein [Flavobacteriaceae bacterium]
MIRFFKSLYIQKRFFIVIAIMVILFVLAFVVPLLFPILQIGLIIIAVFIVLDIFTLYLVKTGINGIRVCPEKLSNGDDNKIQIHIENFYTFPISTIVIDEIPIQFQKRNFQITQKLKAQSDQLFDYKLKPSDRGEYHFGKLNIYVSSPIGLVSKRYIFDDKKMIPCYPSFIQLKKFDFASFSTKTAEHGINKIRRIGHTMEFEQIKDYVTGDDIRSLNWKATAKRNQLMINQYTDEKSQVVYSVIDQGRVMKMPFEGMSLLDYAINATLAVSNVILKKQDKAGIFSFSKKVGNIVVAERRMSQMNYIMETLYNMKTDFFESDYSRLYADIKRRIPNRSLFILYTNFETLDGLNRQLPYLKAIAKNHLLIVVFFQNTELNKIVEKKAKTVREVYDKVAAEKFMFEKKLIVNELKKFGIHSILTEPENLTLNTINKYLEMKARGLH